MAADDDAGMTTTTSNMATSTNAHESTRMKSDSLKDKTRAKSQSQSRVKGRSRHSRQRTDRQKSVSEGHSSHAHDTEANTQSEKPQPEPEPEPEPKPEHSSPQQQQQPHPPTNQPEPKRKRKRKFVGFSERLEEKRREREESTTPRPWVERKFAVGMTIAIAAYTWYVYVGRFVVPMVRRDRGALGGRKMGIAFLAVFCVLGLMFWWCYIKLILTPPGFARDFVPQTSAPQSEPAPRRHITQSRDYRYEYRGTTNPSTGQNDYDEEESIGGPPYSPVTPLEEREQEQQEIQEQQSQTRRSPPPPPASRRSHLRRDSERSMQDRDGGSISIGRRSSISASVGARRQMSREGSSSEHGHHRDGISFSESRNTSIQEHPFRNPKLSPLPPPSEGRRSEGGPSAPAPSSTETGHHRSVDDDLPPPIHSRRPPSHPVLLPEYRYCYKDNLVKPMRTHHCRICGTCVLAFDHHCPWIGQCVGAYNQKFFLNFLQWATLWLYWTFATLLAMNIIKDSAPTASIDPEHIIIIALSALFSIFTTLMLLAHIRFTAVNQTSVETLTFQEMRRREKHVLSRLVPTSDWWKGSNVHKRREAIRREWDFEWGELNTEGNLWWLGSASANWKHRMGRNPWGWFLPVGRSEGDGLTYPTNPRFSEDGRWRRRSEWPPELR